MMESRSRGVLDTPPARGMTALCGAAPSPSLRGAERRSNPFSFFAQRDGLLRSARNDGSTVGCLKIESRTCNGGGELPLPLWERVGVRGSRLSIVRNPSPGSHLSMRSDLSHKGRGETEHLSHVIARSDLAVFGCLKFESELNRPARSLPRPGRLALFAERLEALLGVFRHRQKCDLAFGIGDALVERHRGDRAHGVFAAPDRG